MLINSIIVGLLLSLYLFPIPYIFYKNGKNKFLFISSVIGASLLTELLISLIALPVIIFAIFLMPQLQELGVIGESWILTNLFDFISSYSFLLFTWLSVWLSILIYRKYEIFSKST